MKNYEFYTFYKTNYRPIINPIFYKRNWWQIILITLIAVLVEPIILYKHQRSTPFTFHYYAKVLGYSLLVAAPFITFLLWLNRRESIKRQRGYGWVGKFEVIKKHTSLIFCYLWLIPGNSKLRVDRNVFEKVRVGNFVLIRRNALGNIEEIKKVNNLSSRLTKTEAKRFPKT